jgi:hypothetical protein
MRFEIYMSRQSDKENTKKGRKKQRKSVSPLRSITNHQV